MKRSSRPTLASLLFILLLIAPTFAEAEDTESEDAVIDDASPNDAADDAGADAGEAMAWPEAETPTNEERANAVDVTALGCNHERARPFRIASYVIAGLAGALLVAPMALLVANKSEKEAYTTEYDELEALAYEEFSDYNDDGVVDRNDIIVRESRLSANDALGDKLYRINIATWVLFGVGSTALCVWGVLLALSLVKSRPVQMAFAPTVGGGALTLGWTF